MTGIAGNVLQQSSETYFRRGRAFVQSRMGFLSTRALHYYFNVSSDYGAPHLFCCPLMAHQVLGHEFNVHHSRPMSNAVMQMSMTMLLPLAYILAHMPIAC